MVDGIFVSKICYGLQLLGKVRTSSQDSECADFKEIQLVQNKLLRTLNGCKIIVFVHSETLLLTIVLIHIIRGCFEAVHCTSTFIYYIGIPNQVIDHHTSK